MFDNFNFDELLNTMTVEKKAETKKPEKKAETKKAETKKPATATKTVAIPDAIKNATFKNKVHLITAFGCIDITGESDKLTTADIRAKLLEGEFLHEAAAPNVYYIKAREAEDTDVVIAAVDKIASLNGATAGKITCGES